MKGKRMTIKTLTVGELSTNCYLVYLEGRSDAVVIDPGAEPEKIKAALCGRKAAAVLLTHGHFDHTGALAAFEGTPVYMHPADLIMLSDAEWSGGASFGAAPAPAAAQPLFVQEGARLSLAGLDITVMHLPGHTKGSVGYLIGDALFSGDTLFHRGYGRTDLPGGDFRELRSSLRRLMHLEKDYSVYPGHGAATTISSERGS